jgi:hypothetical protein
MRRELLVFLALALPLPAAAAQPMSAQEFEAYVTGKTLTYNAGGQPYGVEQYLKNRRVRWAFLGDDCVEGQWYEDNGMICFVYENEEGPQCWTFERAAGGLVAHFQSNPASPEIYEARQDDKPMQCLGPKVGT